MCLCVYLSIYVSMCLCVYVSIYLSIYLPSFTYLSVHAGTFNYGRVLVSSSCPWANTCHWILLDCCMEMCWTVWDDEPVITSVTCRGTWMDQYWSHILGNPHQFANYFHVRHATANLMASWSLHVKGFWPGEGRGWETGRLRPEFQGSLAAQMTLCNLGRGRTIYDFPIVSHSFARLVPSFSPFSHHFQSARPLRPLPPPLRWGVGGVCQSDFPGEQLEHG